MSSPELELQELKERALNLGHKVIKIPDKKPKALVEKPKLHLYFENGRWSVREECNKENPAYKSSKQNELKVLALLGLITLAGVERRLTPYEKKNGVVEESESDSESESE